MSRLHVEVAGAGPPLVLLHGWAMHGGVFAPLVERLRDARTLYVVDLPGHGLSTWSHGASTLTALASAVEARLPHRAALIGWSRSTAQIASRTPAATLIGSTWVRTSRSDGTAQASGFWLTGRYMPALSFSSIPRSRGSAITPTIVRQTSPPSVLMRLPSGLAPGQYRSAKAWLTIASADGWAASCGPNVRP